MKSILVINYYWPPSGGSAVQRWTSILKHFDGWGVKCYVITVDDKVATYPNVDISLVSTIPQSIDVIRTDTSDILNVYKKLKGNKKAGNVTVDNSKVSLSEKIFRFIRGNFFIPDARRGWVDHAFRAASKLLDQHNISHFVTAGPPHSTHLVGLRLKRKYSHLTWVMDLHDYWIEHFNLDLYYRAFLANKLDMKYESRSISRADLILVHCQRAKEKLSLRYKGMVDDKVRVHTMGYDESLFLYPHAEYENDKDSFTIAYTGIMASNYEPEVFIKALSECILLFRGKINIHFKFAGTISSDIEALIEKYGIKGNYHFLGYLSHEDSVRILLNSDALLLVNPVHQYDKDIVPGKIYEYLASGKPIISISSHDSENEDLILKHNAGQNFQREDKDELCDYIAGLIHLKLNDTPINRGELRDVSKYSRTNEAHSLLQRLKELPFSE